MARITIQTIATETGLSKFAVSRALAGKSGVSEDTRVRVNEAATRLGYKRTAVAPRLLSVVFDATDIINSELHMQIQAGVQREAARLGYTVRIHSTHDPDELEDFANQCAGMLIVGPHSKESLERAYATGTPIVRSGWLAPLEPVDQIGGTDHEAGSAVAHYLINLGHRNIVYVHGDPRYRGRMERLYGLREVIEQRDDTVLHDMTWKEGNHFAEEFDKLCARDIAPTAYFCAHDGLALTVMSELLARGYHIPRDVSVIGFGDFSAAQQILPQMTTVKMHGVEVGRATVRRLDERINAEVEPIGPLRISIPSVIIERDSAGPAPARD